MIKIFLGSVLLALAGVAAAPGQPSGATIGGAVVDSSRAAVAGANVFIRNPATGRELSAAKTDATGRFNLTIAPGAYEVIAARDGFDAASTVIEATTTEPVEVELTLRPALLSQQVVVSASRAEELAESSITNVEVISREIIRDTGYERVSDILSEQPGIVTRSGSSGNVSETQIQGIDSRQALVLIDGYPVVGARGIKRGILNMDRQSAGQLERIEVVKGASSALFGSDAIGGVLNMITRDAPRRFDANLATSLASFHGVDLRADSGFRHKGWHGFFDVERHKRNPFRLIPGSAAMTGAGFHRWDYLGKLGYDFSDRAKVGLFANAFDNQEAGEFIGELGPQGTTTNDSAQNYGIDLQLGLTPRTQWRSRGYYGKYDESSAIRLFSNPAEIDTNANLNQRLYRLESNISHALGSRQLLQGGGEWTQDHYRGFNRMLGDNNGQQITMTDLWFNDRIEAHRRVSVTAGGRLNSHSLYGSAFVPRVGTMVRLRDDLRLRASWGQGFRAPDLGQLYFRFLNPTNFYQVIGNPNLQPERSTTVQAGLEYRRGRASFQANYFRNDIQDLIQADFIGIPRTTEQLTGFLQTFNLNSAFAPGLNRQFFLYRNLDDVFTRGMEGRAQYSVTRNLIVSSAYTYLDARDKENGQFLSQRHRHHGNFRIWYSTSRLGGLRTNFRGTYFGRWPVVGRGGSQIGDPYQLWDWYVAKPLARGAEMYFSLDNVFNSRDSGLDSARPTFLRADPGRMFRIGMRWGLGAE